jgi:hypothetical protein
VWFAVTILTLASAAARWMAAGSRLPHAPEPDAVIVWQASYLDRPEGAEANARSYSATYYPTLLAQLVAAAPGHSHVALAPLGASDEEHLAAAAEPYRKARTVLALFAALLVPITVLVARRFFEPTWALSAAAFVATSLLALEYGQQARPHAASASANLLAVLAALALVAKPARRNYLLAGVSAAIAVGTLHNGAFTVPALLVAHLLAHGRRWLGLAGALALVALSLRVFYPWLFVLGIFAPGKGGRLDIGGQELGAEHFDGAGFGEIVRGVLGYDPTLLCLAGVGLALGLVVWARAATRPRGERRADILVLAAFPLSFTLMWGIMSRVEPRFVISLVPYLALLAVFALRFLARRFEIGRTACTASVLALLAFPTFVCVKSVALHTRSDTNTLAARWIEAHADKESDRIGINFLYSLPLRQKRAGLEALPDFARNIWERYLLALEDPSDHGWSTHWMFRGGALADRILSGDEALEAARESRVTYAVVIVPADEGTSIDKTRAGIAAHGRLLAHFEACESIPQLAGGGAERGWRALEFVLHADRLGPSIEIYRLD